MGKFPTMVSELMQGPFTLQRHSVAWLACQLTLTLSYSQGKGNTSYFEPLFFGVTLHSSVSVKYLGVILDSQLTCREDVTIKVKKADNSLWVCRRSFGVTWGLRPEVIYWLYVSIIRPSIMIASLVWWPGWQTASAKKWLSRIQRLACLGDNKGHVHYLNKCLRNIHLPSST